MALTRTTDHAEEVTIYQPAAQAFASALAAFQRVGKVQSSQAKFLRITGKVRSGHGNMNKATVTVLVSPVTEDSALVSFKASAQEGLVQQNTAAKAVSRILDSM